MIQLSPADAYEQALSIWTQGWSSKYAEQQEQLQREGRSKITPEEKAEKHRVRRDKLTEFLKTVEDIPALIGVIENRIVECDGRAMMYPAKAEFYRKERAAAEGILTVIQRTSHTQTTNKVRA